LFFVFTKTGEKEGWMERRVVRTEEEALLENKILFTVFLLSSSFFPLKLHR
jgi:hypothetical protein